MIESGVGWAGHLESAPEFMFAWGRAKANPALYFDLASLTKVVVTNSLLIDLMEREQTSLEDFRNNDLGVYLPSAPESLKKIKIGHVWDHSAGLLPHFYLDPLRSRNAFEGERSALWTYVLDQIDKQGLGATDASVYSDLSFWILGALLETHSGKNLQELWQDFKKKYSLPSNDLVYKPQGEEFAVTEKRHIAGEVNDDNACFLQQIAPHAGLFSTAEALWEWMRLMNDWSKDRPELTSYFRPPHAPSDEKRFWCGWDRPTGEKSLAGEGAHSSEVLGHLGYTGTALWWNPLTMWGGLLLTNRVYPAADQNQTLIRDLRIKFFSLLWHNNREELWKALQNTPLNR